MGVEVRARLLTKNKEKLQSVSTLKQNLNTAGSTEATALVWGAGSTLTPS